MHVMDIINKERYDNAVQFLKDCKNTHTHIIHDYDCDGISGGLILHHALTRIGAKTSTSTRMGRGASMHKDELKRLKELQIDRFVINDQDPKSYELYEQFREFFPDTPLLIIDHHSVMQYDDATFIHPEIAYGVRGDKYCSAKFIYDLCAELTSVEDLNWLAAVGILGDANARYFHDFLAGVCTYHDEEVPKDFFEASFAKIADAIDCCSASTEEELLQYVHDLKQHETLEGAIRLGNPCQFIRDAVDEWVGEAQLLAENDGPVVWLYIESQYGIASWVSTIVSFKYPHKIFVGYRQQTDGYAVNCRYQEAKVHMGDIIREVSHEFGGKGGGHAPAAGGFVPTNNWEEFRIAFDNKIKEELEKNGAQAP